MDKMEAKARASPSNVRYSDLYKLCEYYFGPGRNNGGSHVVFKTPWQGEPRINIQNKNGKVNSYQVKQVLAAIAQFKEMKACHPVSVQ